MGQGTRIRLLSPPVPLSHPHSSTGDGPNREFSLPSKENSILMGKIELSNFFRLFDRVGGKVWGRRLGGASPVG